MASRQGQEKMTPATSASLQQTDSATPARRLLIAAQRSQCNVCGGNLAAAIELPGLPLTDTYCREPQQNRFPGLDQRLLFCESCGHAQLETQIAPETLYGTDYGFRTSASATARKGTEFFLAALEQAAPGRTFRCVLDLGCNDLYLLGRLQGVADTRIGIDPVWKGREAECADPAIRVFGSGIEELNLEELPERPDLVVCRHTLEHIGDPASVLRTLLDLAAPDALFLFEVPGFDGLVAKSRFDQVFHQHLQYFSLGSFTALLERVGAQYLLHRENYHDWGALAVAFTRQGGTPAASPATPRHTLADIRKRYRLFRDQMHATRAVLEGLLPGKLYGYGAAQMLPVLAYHLGSDLGFLTAVLDDDPLKEGIGYWNLPVRVMPSSWAQDLSDCSVLITAPDNVQPIMTKLLALRPRHIIYPFHTI
jgi:SAM-dependent methyltransferase